MYAIYIICCQNVARVLVRTSVLIKIHLIMKFIATAKHWSDRKLYKNWLIKTIAFQEIYFGTSSAARLFCSIKIFFYIRDSHKAVQYSITSN